MHNTFRLFYYSPKNTFINVNQPPGSWYTEDSIYKNMELSSSNKQVVPPDSFYVYTPPAQQDINNKGKQCGAERVEKVAAKVDQGGEKNEIPVGRHNATNVPPVPGSHPVPPSAQIYEDTVRPGLYNPSQEGARSQESDPSQFEGGRSKDAQERVRDRQQQRKRPGEIGGLEISKEKLPRRSGDESYPLGQEGGRPSVNPNQSYYAKALDNLNALNKYIDDENSPLPNLSDSTLQTPEKGGLPINTSTPFATGARSKELTIKPTFKTPPEVTNLKTRFNMTPKHVMRNRPASNLRLAANNLGDLHAKLRATPQSKIKKKINFFAEGDVGEKVSQFNHEAEKRNEDMDTSKGAFF